MKIKFWPCGVEKGNPWHFDCKSKKCKKKAEEIGEGLGVTCLNLGKLP